MMVPQVVTAARALEPGDSLLRLWRESGMRVLGRIWRDSGQALLVRGVLGLDSNPELGFANVASIQ